MIGSAETIDLAENYLRDGLPFHAHEVFEARWRCCPVAERSLWRALAQLAAGLTHHARGNNLGAGALLRRATEGLEAYAESRAGDSQDAAPITDARGSVLDFDELVRRIQIALDDDIDALAHDLIALPRALGR